MKVIIDPYRGGKDTGQQINNQYEKNILLNLSTYMAQKLNELGINTELIRNNDISLTDEERNSIINEIKDRNDIIIQNRFSEDNEFDIIYPLRNSDNLASTITKKLEANGIDVDKYYQRRLPSNTTLDYYSIIRNTPPNETLIIEYKDLNNYNQIIDIITNSISEYINKSNIYTVKKGDTLYQIAKKYNINIDELKKTNNLTTNNLSIGQKLTIPQKQIEKPTITTIYTVKKGDTLYQIAKKYNTTVNDIKQLNNLTSNLLSIGQKLKIPELNEIYTIYTVKKGDSLYQIAKKYNTTVNDIKQLNNLTNNLLSIGQELKIP